MSKIGGPTCPNGPNASCCFSARRRASVEKCRVASIGPPELLGLSHKQRCDAAVLLWDEICQSQSVSESGLAAAVQALVQPPLLAVADLDASKLRPSFQGVLLALQLMSVLLLSPCTTRVSTVAKSHSCTCCLLVIALPPCSSPLQPLPLLPSRPRHRDLRIESTASDTRRERLRRYPRLEPHQHSRGWTLASH